MKTEIALEAAKFILTQRSFIRNDEESALTLAEHLRRITLEADMIGYDKGYRAAVRDQIVVRRAG